MEERRCGECGTLIKQGALSCQQCGCPVDGPEQLVEEHKEKERQKTRTISVTAIIALVLGIVILLMGITMATKKENVEGYTSSKAYMSKNYDADTAIFGADFYTEIYGASDTIVDELNDINKTVSGMANDINKAMENASNQANKQLNAIYFSGGMIVMAMGLGIIAIAMTKLTKKCA